MRHKNRKARNRLDFLWKQRVDQERLSTSDNVVSDTGLAEYDITRLVRNFETLDDEVSNLSQTSPILCFSCLCHLRSSVLILLSLSPSNW
jgi:hypothetical protein